jgi:hypothetical protein
MGWKDLEGYGPLYLISRGDFVVISETQPRLSQSKTFKPEIVFVVAKCIGCGSVNILEDYAPRKQETSTGRQKVGRQFSANCTGECISCGTTLESEQWFESTADGWKCTGQSTNSCEIVDIGGLRGIVHDLVKTYGINPGSDESSEDMKD